VWIRPLIAWTLAKAGDFAGAEAVIAQTATDCYFCLRVRGQIATEKHDWAQAEHWFGEAVAQAPSIAFAYVDWGSERLLKGDPQDAIGLFEKAHRAGPHFADALEGWGEALLRKGDPRAASERFRQADRDAPRWARNHARWAEALLRSGDDRRARAQYETAKTLALDAGDRARLDKLFAIAAKN
jgi:tetratricopeptide (TPR) repeat protein